MGYYNDINIERLRDDLIDYYGTAMDTSPMAMMNLIDVEHACDEKLIRIALSNNIDLSNYCDDNYDRKL